MLNVKKNNPFFRSLGMLALGVSALTLLLLVMQICTDMEGHWFGTFVFFIFILAIAGIFINLGDPENLPFIAHYYGMALLFLSISMYSFFSIFYLFHTGKSDILNSKISYKHNFWKGNYTETDIESGEYFKIIFLILVFAGLGFLGFLQKISGDFIVPKIIPYTLAVVGMFIAVTIGFKYLVADASVDNILGELFLFALGAVGFYFSGRMAKLY